MATEIQYLERSIFMKQVNTQNLWTFELGAREGIKCLVWIYVIFQRSDRQHYQNLINDTSYRMPVTSAQCIIGTEKYADSGILLNYDDDDYSQGYTEVKEAFRALTNDNILQLYISEDDFRSSSVGDDGNDNGYNIHSFDIWYQKYFETAQPIKIEFKYSGKYSRLDVWLCFNFYKKIGYHKFRRTTNARFSLNLVFS